MDVAELCDVGACRENRIARSSFRRHGWPNEALKHRISDSGPVNAIELLVAADFFDVEVERIDLVRVDQDCRNSGASEHRCRGATLCTRKGKERLIRGTGTR
ncbi:hypothetical protein ACFIOY_21035 [Bradyrhizobium sp. TZ2]